MKSLRLEQPRFELYVWHLDIRYKIHDTAFIITTVPRVNNFQTISTDCTHSVQHASIFGAYGGILILTVVRPRQILTLISLFACPNYWKNLMRTVATGNESFSLQNTIHVRFSCSVFLLQEMLGLNVLKTIAVALRVPYAYVAYCFHVTYWHSDFH
jgi:hypothetical protein